MRLHIFQHEASCGPGHILEWSESRGVELCWSRFYLDDPVPPLDEVEALLILGGSMNVYQDEQYPHLKAVREFTREALLADKRVFGICLGAQIMADALGERVIQAPHKERGWIDILRRDEANSSPLLKWLPAQHRFFSWHGDTFAIPKGAVHGAASEQCSSQAFAWGNNALAVQFHPESDAAIVSGWIEDEPIETRESLRAQFLLSERFDSQKQLLFAAFDTWMAVHPPA